MNLMPIGKRNEKIEAEIRQPESKGKHKKYNELLFHFLIRETESDRRMHRFGLDPLK